MPPEMCGASPGTWQSSFEGGGNSSGDLREMNLRHYRLSPSKGWRHGRIAEGNLSETLQTERDFYGAESLSHDGRAKRIPQQPKQ